MTHIVLATGGTGGHIYPAVATARELQRRNHRVTLLGERGGMEERVAAEQELPFCGVRAGKLARSAAGLDPRQALSALRGLAEARSFLRRERPGAVVGFGGFASLPGVLAAQSLGIPTVLHEQNARLGLTQRLALRGARAVGTCYAQVRGLPAHKAELVGMPVREEWLLRREAEERLGLQHGPLTILVMGGSQGSLALNGAVPGVLRGILGETGLTPGGAPGVGDDSGGDGVQVIHATGPRWIGEVLPEVRDRPWYTATGYVDAVAAWSAADLAITRAGTGTLAEAAFHGVPLVMVPLPGSAEDHQRHNARAVEAAGAGVLLEQDKLSGALGALVLQCLDGPRREAMHRAALARSPQGAAARLASLVERQLHAVATPAPI